MSKSKSAIISGLIFWALMTCFFIFQHGLWFGIIGGAVSGVIFGFFMYFFTGSKIIERQTQIHIPANDGVILSGGANHFLNFEAVGGKLYLLHDRLQFKSHSLNIQKHELQIPLNNIKAVTFYNVLGLVPNGLSIETKGGRTEKFVINNRKRWKTEIDTVRTLNFI